MQFDVSERLKQLPPYLFLEIDKAKRQAMAQGRDVINLGVGDPDQTTHKPIIEAMKKAIEDGSNHHYPFDAGVPQLRVDIAKWFKARFGVDLDPASEIYPLIGSKEGLAHFPLAVINPGDKVLLTDPAYPAYQAAVTFASGKIQYLPLKASNDFLPKIADIAEAKNVKAMIVCYPNNPTSAVANKQFYTDLVKVCTEKNIIIVSDLAYSEVYYDGVKPPSILEIPGAKDIAIEFHSFSKTYFMTGWRLGWACGNSQLIAALAKVKSNVDSGVFNAIQHAGIAALKLDPAEIEDMRASYQERRDALINGCRSIGWKIDPPKAAFYVWAKIPAKFPDSMSCAKAFLDQADIVMTPGVGFGKSGEGYVRMSLTLPVERIHEAVGRMAKVLAADVIPSPQGEGSQT
ncbi:MAG: LL-diaminopimelate aminotransferase [Candidatus Omnitrophica bacterium]|nr:LL-diaminopimelate aminotransferase [Candidatus Omnitrophota bacterium]